MIWEMIIVGYFFGEIGFSHMGMNFSQSKKHVYLIYLYGQVSDNFLQPRNNLFYGANFLTVIRLRRESTRSWWSVTRSLNVLLRNTKKENITFALMICSLCFLANPKGPQPARLTKPWSMGLMGLNGRQTGMSSLVSSRSRSERLETN